MVLTLLGVIGTGRAASAGFVTYHVVVDTSSIAFGTNGSLEFQYNPAMTPVTVSTAVISNFTTVGGVVSPMTDVIGSVSGDLANLPLTITADTPLNDILENFAFGTSFAFDLTLDGTPAPADRFSLTIYPGDITAVNNGTVDAVLSIPGDLSGAALTIDYDGLTPSIIQASPQVTVSAVPEPSTIALLAAAGPFLLVYFRRDRRRRVIQLRGLGGFASA